MIKIKLILLILILSSCNSIDVERTIRPSMGAGRQGPGPEDPGSGIIIISIESENEAEPMEPVIIERPVYIPEGQPLPDPPAGRAAVEAASRAIVNPRDFSNAAMIYDYHRDFVYEIYCQPLRVTNITLEPGERMVDIPFISDSERWMLGAGVSYNSGVPVQHVYVRPTTGNLQATLIINTHTRVYQIILRSFSDVHMPIVRWRYHDTAMPQRYINPAIAPAAPGTSGTGTVSLEREDETGFVDPNFLSFDYIIRFGFFRRPAWLPTLVYDDGRRTYITFPEQVLQREMPAVFENRTNLINYRVNRNVIIIDKLVEHVSIRLGNQTVTVEKNRRRR